MDIPNEHNCRPLTISQTINSVVYDIHDMRSGLGIALDYLGGVILFCATITSIWTAIHLNLSPAYVGLVMTYTLLVPIYLNWLVRNIASLEMYMSSVERVQEYSHLDTEDQRLVSMDADLPQDWPQNGEIEFNDVSLKYESSAEPIIRNANFHIRPGQKVCIGHSFDHLLDTHRY